MIKQDVKVIIWVIQEVFDETTVEQVAVDIKIFVSVDHIFVLLRVGGVSDLAILRLSRLIALLAPLICNWRAIGICGQTGKRFRVILGVQVLSLVLLFFCLNLR